MKIFGIGLNKTGTTSLGHYFQNMGYLSYCNWTAKMLRMALNNDPEMYEIIDKFDVFQDWPWPIIYKRLYNKYSDAKFILTLRNTPEEWFISFCNHSHKMGRQITRKIIYGYDYPSEENKKEHIEFYNNHNNDVIEFFKNKKNKKDKLLILKTNDINKEQKICDFIKIPYNNIKYPHSNKGNY